MGLSDFTGWGSLVFLGGAASPWAFRYGYGALKRAADGGYVSRSVRVLWQGMRRWHSALAVVFLALALVHTGIEYMRAGLNPTGLVALGVLALLFISGVLLYGRLGPRPLALKLHRILTVVLVLVLCVHVLNPRAFSDGARHRYGAGSTGKVHAPAAAESAQPIDKDAMKQVDAQSGATARASG